MASLTIAIDDETLRRARSRAREQGTSINAVLRDFLETYSGIQEARARAIDTLLELSEASNSSRGGQQWTRDSLHED